MFLIMIYITFSVLLLILGITFVKYLIKMLPRFIHMLEKLDVKSPVPAARVRCRSDYYEMPRISNWAYVENRYNYERDFQTPIQRIPGMRRLRLQHRALIMPTVRRRLDKQF